MKKQILVITAMFIMGAVGCCYADAGPLPKPGAPEGPGGEMPGLGPEKDVELLVVALDLTAVQQEQLQKVLAAERARHEDALQGLRDEEQELHRMLDETAFDEAAFRTLAAKVAEKRTDLMIAHAKLKPQLLAVLSTAQQAKAEQIFKLMSPPPHHGPGKPF